MLAQDQSCPQHKAFTVLPSLTVDVCSCSYSQVFSTQNYNWWLVELPMWLTDGFLLTFIGRWRGRCACTLIPLWLTCGSRADGGGGGDSELQKTRKVRKTSNFYKVGGEH